MAHAPWGQPTPWQHPLGQQPVQQQYQGGGFLGPLGVIGANILAANNQPGVRMNTAGAIGQGLTNALPQIGRMQQMKFAREQQKLGADQRAEISKLAEAGLKTIDIDGDGNISPQERARESLLKIAVTNGDPKYISAAESLLGPTQQSAFSEKLSLMGYQRGTPEHATAARELAMRPGTSVTVNQPPTGYGPDPQDPTRLTAIPGGPADPANPKNVTEGQRTAAGYLQRMQAAEQRMSDVIASGFNPASPLEAARGVTNATATAGYRQYHQAQRDWVRAKLRRESGAVIAESEMAEEIATYFPETFDDDLTQAQKKAARQDAERQLTIGAAGAVQGTNKRYVFGGKRP